MVQPRFPESLDAVPAIATAMAELRAAPRRWLVTGGAGFIGSHLVEALVTLGQEVVVFDDLSTGSRANLDDVGARVGAERAALLRVVVGDLRDAAAVTAASDGVAVVLHHAAQVSVPASIDDPVTTHAVNVTGFLHVLEAARVRGARVVFAASSASYGDDDADVKVESRVGRPLSMYAASKSANEVYAAAYGRAHALETVGLRYFNVFGARQDPKGAYAAVIPAWTEALLAGKVCRIHGDGLTTRDFCHVANVVGANLLAATTQASPALGSVFNIGTGDRTTLLELHEAVLTAVRTVRSGPAERLEDAPEFGPFRAGDVRHSCADVGLARRVLGFEPVVDLHEGIARTVPWFAGGGAVSEGR